MKTGLRADKRSGSVPFLPARDWSFFANRLEHALQEYLVWNPPYIDEIDRKQGRVSTIAETSRVFRFMMTRGIRVIVFCRVSCVVPEPTRRAHG